jgi:hypothetical protein
VYACWRGTAVSFIGHRLFTFQSIVALPDFFRFLMPPKR